MEQLIRGKYVIEKDKAEYVMQHERHQYGFCCLWCSTKELLQLINQTENEIELSGF